MTKLMMRIHDLLWRHRWLAAAGLLLLVGVCVWLASRMVYEEDIARFLPRNAENERYAEVYQDIANQNRVAIVFAPADTTVATADPDSLLAAMDVLADELAMADTAGMVSDLQTRAGTDAAQTVAQWVMANYPYFLTAADYARADSLLAEPDAVENRLAAVKQQLMLPTASLVAQTLPSDPLGLFTPVLQALRGMGGQNGFQLIDGAVFTADGQRSLAWFTAGGSVSESSQNARLAALLDTAMARTQRMMPSVRVTAVGAPLIAVTNANQIKHDSLLAMCVAVTLIILLLAWHYRRVSDLLWIAVSLAFGWLMAIAGMAILKDSVSVIVLGIGSVIIGISANYPLHFLDHLREVPDRREALREMVAPLLIGNITTVAAFLCLVWLDAEAMRDLGAFGSLMLVGTIMFVLVFLPLWVRVRRSAARPSVLPLRSFNLTTRRQRRIFVVVVSVLTLLLGWLSLKTSFDDDIRHINYMTDQQRADLSLLSSAGAGGDDVQLYAVASGSSLDEALAVNEQLQTVLDTLPVRGVSRFLPTMPQQRRRLSLWEDFWARHGESVSSQLRAEGARQGFSPDAFEPFLTMISTKPSPQPADYFSPLAEALGGSYVIGDSLETRVVSYVTLPQGADEEVVKSRLRERLPAGAMLFSTRDIGNQLVQTLNDSFNYIGFVCGFVVFFFLWISFYRLELSLVSFLPLAVGWIWILGIMQLFGLQFNIVNIILATFIFGQGDDYTIFITEGLVYEYAYGKRRLDSYKRSVVLSAVIMFIGIGALILSRHPALRSLALVTIVGMATVVFMAYYLPPLVFRWITRDGHDRVREVPQTLARLGRSLWGITYFVFMSTCVLKPYTWLFFKIKGDNERTRDAYHGLLQNIAKWVSRHVPGMKFTLDNSVGETFERPAVLVSNHQSHLDLMCLMMLTDKMVFFTNDWTWNNAFYGSVIRRAEFLPATGGIEENLPKIKELYRRGYTIAIFPEGTRSDEHQILRFHKGPFYLAEQLGADILPVVLHGVGHVLPKRDFMLRKGSAYVKVLPRIMPGDTAYGSDYRQRARLVRQYFTAQYAALREQLEDADYCATFVRYQYMYKGAEVERRCRRNLKHNHNYASVVNDPANRSLATLLVDNCGQGELPYIFALAHPATQVFARPADADDHALLTAMANLPDNLHIVAVDATPPACDKVITLPL